MLILQHLRLPLDGTISEQAPAATPSAGNSKPNERATSDESSLLPLRLLGAARLLSITDGAALSTLPVARADESPLSDSNEAAALALLAQTCEEALAAFGPDGNGEQPASVEGGGDEGATTSKGAKRKRHTQGRSSDSERAKLGREMCAQQRSLYIEALAELRERQERLAAVA
eukprot:2409087-Prymnesium_polylepis.1